ncbi:TetR/AcrR family transcriptional regulator [Psychrobacter ciconiae]|uniref:TetR/AcrR family transcriptional regulator n=1 Tax=Psychrobacter ciconiae TaxID=1553449 RepID=UPI001918F623|nr:TetR/AcrR family transcriptional regulator [Psychrobacter ciconiae]
MTEPRFLKPQTNSHQDTKTQLLEVGYQLLSKKGFSAVGLQQILTTAGIPKGSFYHYFASKEAFGEAIIEHYFLQYQARLDALARTQTRANQALYHYFAQWYNTQQSSCDVDKCLVVKLSAEVADLSEAMTKALYQGYEQTINWLAAQIEASFESGDMALTAISAKSLAKRWYFAWLGASLVAKISRSNAPLDEVWQMTCDSLNISAELPS